jgi:hypothetical protein
MGGEVAVSNEHCVAKTRREKGKDAQEIPLRIQGVFNIFRGCPGWVCSRKSTDSTDRKRIKGFSKRTS